MIESQIVQLAASIPPADKGKILGQPEDVETVNLIDIHNAAFYYIQPSEGRWIDYTLSDKKDDPWRPVIPSPLDVTSSKKLSVTSEQVSTSCLR
jgi:hypothetical protein